MTTPDRPSTPPRRFDRGDRTILVGALAVFLCLAVDSWRHPIPGDGDVGWTFYRPAAPEPPTGPPDIVATTREIIGTGWTVATFALALIRIRRPRPRWQRLMRQPGWVAAISASIAAGVSFVQDQLRQFEAVVLAVRWSGGAEVHVLTRVTLFPKPAAVLGCLGVLVSWIILRWGGRWRPERSWVDRSGRLIGWGWLVMPLGILWGRLTSLWA